jgi:hypothetical protein
MLYEKNMDNEEYFKGDTENDAGEEFGEIVFKTDIADKPDKPWWRLIPTGIGCGAVIGFLLWFQYGRAADWICLAEWGGGGAILMGILVTLPFFRKTELKKLHVSEKGFRVIDRSGERSYAWGDIEAAHFETYPVSNMHTEIHCFEFRTAGRNNQLMIDGLGKNGLQAFYVVINHFLKIKGIAHETKELRTFAHTLSLCAAWIFAGSIALIVIAHLLVFPTLGTIIGLSLMLTGAGMSFLSREQQISKWVLVATVVVVIGTIVLVHLFDINIRNTLLKWEERERSLGRPPWSDTK